MAFEIVRRFRDGAWKTEAADEAGNGGSLPGGGTTGEALLKASNVDGDADWGPTFVGSDKWASYIGETSTDVVSVLLDWGSLADGTALVDLTDSTRPTALVDGVYAVNVTVFLPATASGVAHLQADLDSDGIDIRTAQSLPYAANEGEDLSVTVVGFCPAGGVIEVSGRQSSGSPQAWDPVITLQRIA